MTYQGCFGGDDREPMKDFVQTVVSQGRLVLADPMRRTWRWGAARVELRQELCVFEWVWILRAGRKGRLRQAGYLHRWLPSYRGELIRGLLEVRA